MKKLNFGCGPIIKKGWDNVDIQKGKGIDVSFDFDKLPYPLDNNVYDYVDMSLVIEHLIYPDRVLKELWRICKHGATIKIRTAHYTNKGAYNDLQHRGVFNENAFINFAQQCTNINKKPIFKIKSLIITPTRIGKWIPRVIREFLSLFLGGLLSEIHVEYKVIKNNSYEEIFK